MGHQSRIREVDAMRGTAILLMLAYHFSFDLKYLGIAAIDLDGVGWVLLQRLIAVMFLTLVGISLTLNESGNTEGYARYAKRAIMLGAFSLAITAATWLYDRAAFIEFGIIHMIAVSTLLAPLFFRLGKWNLLAGLLVISAGFYNLQIIADGPLAWLGIAQPARYSLDLYSMIPWFGVVLVGLYCGYRFFPGGTPGREFGSISKWLGNGPLSFLGKNSLAVYLLHQPAFIAMLSLLRAF